MQSKLSFFLERELGFIGSPSKDSICMRLESWLHQHANTGVKVGGNRGCLLEAPSGGGKTIFLKSLESIGGKLNMQDHLKYEATYLDMDHIA